MKGPTSIRYCFAKELHKQIAESAFDEHDLNLFFKLMFQAQNQKKTVERTILTAFNFYSEKLETLVEFFVSIDKQVLKIHAVRINTQASTQKTEKMHLRTAISFFLRILMLVATGTGEKSIHLLDETLISIKKVFENLLK